MKALFTGLIVILALLQWRLWFGDGGVSELRALKNQLASQLAENEQLRLRNEMLEHEVLDLKNGLDAIEERARTDLGMIREDETFYMVIQ
jgi:cell division protein FtsB